MADLPGGALNPHWYTDQLIFRYLTLEDIAPLTVMLAKDTVCAQVFYGPNTDVATRAYFEPRVSRIQGALDHGERPEEHEFAILHRRTGQFAGTCAVVPVEYSPGTWMVGYQLDDVYWRNGHGTMAGQFTVQYAMLALEAQRLVAECMASNHASRRILESCGFALEGIQRQHWPLGEGRVDNLLFGLLAGEVPLDILRRWQCQFIGG